MTPLATTDDDVLRTEGVTPPDGMDSETGTPAPAATAPLPTYPAGTEKLLSLRQSIDNIDAALVHMLAERFKFTQEVGVLKATTGMPASDPAREAVQIARLRALAEESHLDPAFAEKFLNFIVAEVIQHHEQIASSTGPIATQ